MRPWRSSYYGEDAPGNTDRRRFHTDDSFMVKYYDHQKAFISQGAASLTVDYGFESGGGVEASSQYFVGFMVYNRLWFSGNRFGLTVGGGAIRNPGRYLVLVPPINGATALSRTGYFTANPGDPFEAWDTQVSVDYSPQAFVTFRLEYNFREANVAYFAGHGALTPPGGNQGSPGSLVASWSPDLVKVERRVSLAMQVKM